MTELTDEAVKALLDGATPGRWVMETVRTSCGTCHRIGPFPRPAYASKSEGWACVYDDYPPGVGSPDLLANSRLIAAAPDLARALLDASAELARVKADAAAAMALVVERAAENKEQLDIWAQEILEGLSFADVLKITSYDDKIEAHNIVGRGLVDVIRTLAPADALAEVQRLRVEARENAMQALASMGQAQEAYEAQLEAEAERDRLRDRDRVLSDFIADFAAAKIDALRYQPAYGESPEDAPDPVVDAETVWAWQADARAALAKPAEKAGARC